MVVSPSITTNGVSPLGANLESFVAKTSAKGSFSFTRAHGNPSNIAFDGLTYTMGTATWVVGCVDDGVGNVSCNTPTTQTVLLHINDSDECAKLYGEGSSDTCWVFPGGVAPPSPLCNGDPACKSAVIDEANGDFDQNGFPFVPLKTLLHIHYTYVIVNQSGSGVTMKFNAPIPGKTKDINSGGGKDYFGCEQIPDSSLSPGGWINPFLNYQNTGFTFAFTQGTGNGCSQSRFTMYSPSPGPITLTPGQSVSFTVDMITRKNKGGQQDYSSPGPHVLNSGFTIKWFQNGPGNSCPNWVNAGTLCSFSTGITPLYINAQ